MATAKKMPSGNYRIRVYDKQTGKYKSFTAETKREAEYLANEWLTGRKPKSIMDSTLQECINKYIQLKSDILSPSTIDKYERIAKHQLSEDILSQSISSIDQLKIQAEVNRLTKVYAPKTVHSAYGLVSTVLKTYNPNFRYNVTLPKIQKRTRRLPTADEIIQVFKGSGEMELIVLLAMWQGLRASEIRGLKKSDFKDGKLYINRVIVTVGNKFIEKETAKTPESKRGVSVPHIIQDKVDNIQDEYITHMSGQAIYKRFVKKMAKCGYTGVTFHDMRHINASVMLQLGIPDKYAMERGGWSMPDTLKRVYQETFDNEREAVDKRIDNYFSQIYDTKYDTDY